MKVHLVQMDIAWRDKSANYAKVKRLLDASPVRGGDFVVLPEMFATGFDVQAEGIVEGDSLCLAQTGMFLSEIARERGICIFGSGITPCSSGKRQNIVQGFGPDGQSLGSYQKMHPFTFGGEHKRFSAGEGIVLFDVFGVSMAPFICYDLRFPELFRHAVLQGAKIMTVSANWPGTRHAHWLPLLQARAIENQCFVLGVNRVGRDQYFPYEGQSVAYGPKGEQLALAGSTECLLTVELDMEYLTSWRESFPVLQDIRCPLLGL
jgi:omega-amidase